MIKDVTKWNLGVSKLSGFMKFVREPFDQEKVQQYHDIVALLEESSGEDLSEFKILPDKLKPQIISVQSASFSGRPGRIQYSDNKECDPGFFRSHIDGLASYLPLLRGPKNVDKGNPYDSLPDHKIEEMLVHRKLKPKRIVDQDGERFVFDRAHGIAALLKDDNPSAAPSISNVFNIRDSNVVHSSPGSTVTQSSGIKAEELQRILTDLKQISSTSELAGEKRAQLDIDVATIELQVKSANPNPSIIRASLESAKRILEHAAGIVLGETAVFAIKGYLGMS